MDIDRNKNATFLDYRVRREGPCVIHEDIREEVNEEKRKRMKEELKGMDKQAEGIQTFGDEAKSLPGSTAGNVISNKWSN